MLATAAVSMHPPQQVRTPDSFRQFEGVLSSSLRVKRGHSLFHAGDEFSSIYAVRFGSFKTFAGDYEGRQQVTGFTLAGDFLGLDGIGSGRQTVTAVALEDSEVIILPFASLERAARDDRDLQHELHALLSRQIVQDHGVMMMLGSLCASARLAAFLLTLSRRYQRLGYSPVDFRLRMSRADIGSYLGLKIETVSRTMTVFAEQGLIEIHDKHVRIVDLDGLERTWSDDGKRTRIGDPTRTSLAIEQARMVRADACNTRRASATARSLSESMRSHREEAGL